MAKGDDKTVAPQLGKVQQEEVKVGNAGDANSATSLQDKEGVGSVKVKLNSDLGFTSLEFNEVDNDGNVTKTETFDAGEVHLVSEELAKAENQAGEKYFVSAD